METSSGILGRLGEKILSWIALGLIVAVGWGIYKMPAETKGAIWSSAWRTGTWVAIVVAVPWIGRFFIRRVLEIGSNWAAAAFIALLVVIDISAAACLMTGWPTGGWTWFLSLAALGLAGTYNYLVTEYLADQTGV